MLIVTYIGIDINRYPTVFAHLNQWQVKLKQRSDKGNYWWELRACSYYHEFEQAKIIFPIIAKKSRFTFDDKGFFNHGKAFIIPLKDFALLDILNSVVVGKYLKNLCSVFGDTDKGGRLELKAIYMNQIPLPNASTTEREAISKLVQKCLDAKKINCEEWEK